jgi:HSP20 family protein
MSKLMRRNGNGTALINRMQDEMEDMFNRMFVPFAEPTAGAVGWAPSVDIEETGKEIVVKADLPGVDAKDVEVTIQNGSLILRGEKKEQREEKGTNYHRVERFDGVFYRAIPLPAETDATTVTATSSKGVVTVTIPKKPSAQAKRILVQSKD